MRKKIRCCNVSQDALHYTNVSRKSAKTDDQEELLMLNCCKCQATVIFHIRKQPDGVVLHTQRMAGKPARKFLSSVKTMQLVKDSGIETHKKAENYHYGCPHPKDSSKQLKKQLKTGKQETIKTEVNIYYENEDTRSYAG